ncbi:MAG: 1-acyl-sn-glycerol-3-phosphate acyltransferase, partial [Undibacterium curvum]
VIRYVDMQGEFHPAANFIGDMTFVDSMREILKAPKMRAELIRLPAIPTRDAHRREVAQQARTAAQQALNIAEAA